MVHPFHHYPSTYLATLSWASMGFMAQPTLASLAVHVGNLGVLALVVWLAHWEGRKQP